MRHSGSDDDKKTTHLNSGMKDLRYPPNATATETNYKRRPIRLRKCTPDLPHVGTPPSSLHRKIPLKAPLWLR